MSESVKDLVVRLAFEHGDTKQQIAAINAELKLLDSGFAASAAMAAGFSGGLNQTGSAADQLRTKLAAQQQLVAKYGQAIEQANEKLKKSVAAHEQQGAKLEELRAKQQQLSADKERLIAAMEQEKAANGETSAAYQQMAASLEQLNTEIAANEDAINRQEAAYARSDRAINRNAQTVMRLETEQNRARAAMAETEAALQREEDRLAGNAEAWERAAQAADQFAESANGASAWQTKAGKTLTKASAAIAGMGVAAGKAAIDWESSFAGVRKTVDGTEKQLQDLHDALLGMEVPTDYEDLAEIAANAGQLGIATDNVAGFTRTMADLAETTDLTAEAAAESFAQYANITGMPQENIGRLGSVTVELGNNLATTESKIVAFAQAIGSAGHQAGMTDRQIFGIAGGLASLGLEAQAGGTAFSKAIIGMQVAVETGSADLQKYADVCGTTVEAFKRSFSQDAAGTFIKFVEGLSSGSRSAIVMLDEMGITETRLRDTLLRASNASRLMTQSVDMANRAWEENSALTKEAEVRYGTTASRMKMTGKQAQKVAMDFGRAILPLLEKGLDGIGGILDKFNALDDAQRAGIVKWAAYAAAVGPALTLIGKANGLLGSAASGFSQLATAMAEGGGGLSGLLSGLGSLLGPAGIAAAAVGIGLATYKLYDYASGAQAAREATEALNKQAREWRNTQAETLYDTGNRGGALARFGLSQEDFGAADKEAQDWMERLMATWTDGKAETNQIVTAYVDEFTKGTDEVRKAIEGQAGLLGEYGAMTPEARANLDSDLAQLDAYDKEVAALLKKRQNGLLTEAEQARLGEILQARVEIRQKYELNTDGYDQIVTQMRAEIERLRSLGEEGGGSELMGDTLNALAEGRRAYTDALNADYDAEYARIQQIEDETARQSALNALNERYNAQRLQGEADYADAVKEAAAAAWEQGGYEAQVGQLNELLKLLGDPENINIPKIKDMVEGMDEGQLASMLSLVEQLKAAGMSDRELMDLGIDTDDLYTKITALRDLADGIEGLEGVGEMFGKALPEEIQRIMVGLDMTQAAADWAAFAEGGDLAKIKAGVAPEETVIELQGEITEVAKRPGAKLTVDAEGNITKVKTAEGVTYTADGDGIITSVIMRDGLTFRVDKGTGTVTEVITPEGERIELAGEVAEVTKQPGAKLTVDADGNITRVETADGVRYTVNGDGSITRVEVAKGVTAPVLSATASVTLNPLDQAAIAAWEQANGDVSVTGPKAKVGVQLGAGWTGELQRAFEAGKLALYGADGLPLEVTPDVMSRITAEDVAMLGEDGTIHVIITPELGTEGGVEAAEGRMEAKTGKGSFVEPLFASTQDKVDDIRQLSAAVEEYRGLAEQAKRAGDPGLSQTWSEAATGAQMELLNTIQQLSEADLSNIGGQIINLMAALEGGEGSAEQLAEWEAQLQELLSFVDAIGPDAYAGTGESVAEGIARGMAAYGWAGDAGTVASAIQTAINGALAINSPSKVMEPTGQGVSEGIAEGMKGYGWAGDAAVMAGGIRSAFGGLAGQATAIGQSFDAGLAQGIRAGRSQVIAAAMQVAREAVLRTKEALDMHSPSKVTEEMGRMFDLGFVRGIEAEMPRISSAAVEALVPQAVRSGGNTVVRQSTDNRDMSISAPINVDRLEVRDDRDIEALSNELYGLIRRDQRLLGARR